MTPGFKAIELIKRWEGCKLKSYLDQAGRWTIGYGQTGPYIVSGLTITQTEADRWLNNQLTLVGQQVERVVNVKLEQYQFDALVSLVYNVGIGAFQHSNMLKKINQKLYDQAAVEFLDWDHINGIEIPGLRLRRSDERQLYLNY